MAGEFRVSARMRHATDNVKCLPRCLPAAVGGHRRPQEATASSSDFSPIALRPVLIRPKNLSHSIDVRSLLESYVRASRQILLCRSHSELAALGQPLVSWNEFDARLNVSKHNYSEYLAVPEDLRD